MIKNQSKKMSNDTLVNYDLILTIMHMLVTLMKIHIVNVVAAHPHYLKHLLKNY